MRLAVWAAPALLLAGCATAPRTEPPVVPAPGASLTERAAAVAADARRSDAAGNSSQRGALASDATQNADACIAQQPQAVECLYGRAVALGLEARAHPIRAGELLNAMLGSLAAAEAADAGYDEAGPARVRALVLIRSPGWPVGPGDPESGLAAARRAAGLRPQYPPNQLALAEALVKNGDPDAARRAYEQAHVLALALAPSADRDEWLRQAEQGLRPP